MKNITIITLLFFISIIKADYGVTNAFPNLIFDDPVGIYHADDNSNRIFVIEQEGKIKVFNNDSNVASANVFLNLTSIVDQDGGYTEEGLLGLAFHPNYSENGYFYVNYNNEIIFIYNTTYNTFF